ncbi:unnamed protein product, partial [Musa banksii]
MLMVICSIAIGLSFGHTAKGVMATLCLFRFCLGFGIGGDYLLSATIMSEYANKKTRGAFIAIVFTTQGFGILTGGIVSIIISVAFKERFDYPAYRDDRAGSTVPEADCIWCTTLMLGALPAALTYYWRMKMPETVRYTALVAKNAKRAAPECRGIIRQAQACSPLTSGSIGLVRSQQAASLPRPLGLMRSQHTALLAASATRPHAQQVARCLAASLPRLLGLMRSLGPSALGHSASCVASSLAAAALGHSASCAASSLAAAATRPRAQPASCLAASVTRPHAQPAHCLAASASRPRAQPASHSASCAASTASLATRPHAQPAHCLAAATALLPRCLVATRPHAQPAHCLAASLPVPSASCAATASLPRPLGLVRSQQASLPCAALLPRPRRPQPATASPRLASQPRPHAQPARCLPGCLLASAPRSLWPHAQPAHCLAASATRPRAQPASSLGHSASCASQHTALLPRCLGHWPHAQPAHCLAASATRPQPAASLPRPLGLMRSKVA